MNAPIPDTNNLPSIDIKDIHLPEQISNFPSSIGWWGLLIIMIVILSYVLIRILSHHKKCKDKKHALNILKNRPNAEQTLSLLKWSAMQYFPRNQVAKLFGVEFQSFLSQKLNEKHAIKFVSLSPSPKLYFPEKVIEL